MDSISKEDLDAFIPFLSLTKEEKREKEVIVGEENLETDNNLLTSVRGNHLAVHSILSVVHHQGPNSRQHAEYSHKHEKQHTSNDSHAQVVIDPEILHLYPREIVLIVEKLLHAVHSSDILSHQKQNAFDEQHENEMMLAKQIHEIIGLRQNKADSVNLKLKPVVIKY